MDRERTFTYNENKTTQSQRQMWQFGLPTSAKGARNLRNPPSATHAQNQQTKKYQNSTFKKKNPTPSL